VTTNTQAATIRIPQLPISMWRHC